LRRDIGQMDVAGFGRRLALGYDFHGFFRFKSASAPSISIQLPLRSIL
jgi:hypothetical protein